MRLGIVLLATASILLGACASKVETEVTRFHKGALPQGETVRIVHADQGREGPEFDQYADLIRQDLARLGYSPVQEGSTADLTVEVDYSVSEGRTRIDERPGYGYPYYSYRFGVFYPYHHAFIHPHFFDGYAGPRIRSQTVYTRSLRMRIIESGSEDVVFEGRVVSEGREQEISRVMPYLVESMFRNFPGESGTTKVVDIKTKDGERY